MIGTMQESFQNYCLGVDDREEVGLRTGGLFRCATV